MDQFSKQEQDRQQMIEQLNNQKRDIDNYKVLLINMINNLKSISITIDEKKKLQENELLDKDIMIKILNDQLNENAQITTLLKQQLLAKEKHIEELEERLKNLENEKEERKKQTNSYDDIDDDFSIFLKSRLDTKNSQKNETNELPKSLYEINEADDMDDDFSIFLKNRKKSVYSVKNTTDDGTYESSNNNHKNDVNDTESLLSKFLKNKK